MVSTVPPQLAQTYWRSPLTWLVMRSRSNPGKATGRFARCRCRRHDAATLRGSVPLSRRPARRLLLDGGRRPYRLAKAYGGPMSLQEAVRYEGLSSKSYEHPADRAATAALRSIPLMDKVVKRLVGFGHERRLRQVLIGNAVQISDHQVPNLWARHCWAASVLDVEAVPELFVTQTPLANALTVGAKRPMVIIFSGLAERLQPQRSGRRTGARNGPRPVRALLLPDGFAVPVHDRHELGQRRRRIGRAFL